MTADHLRSALVVLLAGGLVSLLGLWMFGVGVFGRGSMDGLGLLFGPLILVGGATGLLAARRLQHERRSGTVLAVLFATVVGEFMALNVARHMQSVLAARTSIESMPDNVIGGPIEAAPAIDMVAVAPPAVMAIACAVVLVLLLIRSIARRRQQAARSA